MTITINIHGHCIDHEQVQSITEIIEHECVSFSYQVEGGDQVHGAAPLRMGIAHDQGYPNALDPDYATEQLADLTDYVQSLADDARQRAEREPTKQWWVAHELLHTAAAHIRGAKAQLIASALDDEQIEHAADSLCTDPFCDVDHSQPADEQAGEPGEGVDGEHRHDDDDDHHGSAEGGEPEVHEWADLVDTSSDDTTTAVPRDEVREAITTITYSALKSLAGDHGVHERAQFLAIVDGLARDAWGDEQS